MPLNGGMAITTCIYLGSSLTTDHDISSPKNGVPIHQNRHLSLFRFRLACLHILRTLLGVILWSLSMSFNPAMRISSAMPNTFCSPWDSWSIFLWNISPDGATPNGSSMYLYLPKGQEKVIKYYDYTSSSLSCGTLGLHQWIMRYLTSANLSKMSLRVRSLWIGLIRTLFNWARSKHNVIFLFVFGTNMKLLHHSDVSSTSRSKIICCFCSLSSSFYGGSCSA